MTESAGPVKDREGDPAQDTTEVVAADAAADDDACAITIEDLDHHERFFNRELSWLAFNSRVLAIAEDERVPLLERLKFLAIWSTNLDEYFMVRVAGLKDQIDRGSSSRTPDGHTPAQQLVAIRAELDTQVERVSAAFREVRRNLADHGVALVSWADLQPADREYLATDFEKRMFPVLTPLAVDPGHPFPYISNLSLSLGVILRDPTEGTRRFARLKVPQTLGRFLPLPDGERFVPIEEVVQAHLHMLFSGMEVTDKVAFRVTRNADLDIDEDEVSNMLSAVESELSRSRFQNAVRLEVGHAMHPDIKELLESELELDPLDIYVSDIPMALGDLWELYALDRPDLKDEPYTPLVPLPFRPDDDERADVFKLMRERDVLVHHPYESFNATVGELLRQASRDPLVQAIKLTIYRTSGDSPIVDHLVRAAESGKQVAVVVELKARFDEAANIAWARQLEEAGVHVAYGLVGLKVHSKTCLIVRAEADGIRNYAHVGTGNYNPLTARFYTDFGLFTTDPDIGADLVQLFNSLTGYGRDVDYRRLLVAPTGMRRRIVELIDREAAMGPAGRITMKMNSLVDAAIIERLYEASQAGVRINLITRGICCLRPGIRGLSENIRVLSVVGKYLEHPRIYYFANGRGEGDPEYLIGSGDIMPRNLDRRVEVLVPIEDPRGRRQLDQVLEIGLADERLGWELHWDGTWVRGRGDELTNSQHRLEELARGMAPAVSQIEVFASGGLIIRDHAVLLVHRPKYGDWTFPKGKVEPGEDPDETALREVEEETGMRCALGREVRSIRYLDNKGRRKQVRYWLMTVEGGEFVPNKEVDEIRWVPIDEARRVLSYPHDLDLLEVAASVD